MLLVRVKWHKSINQPLNSMDSQQREKIEQRAKNLLEIHNGVCSVRDDSDLGRAYREMEKAGEVEISHQGGIVGYIRIERKGTPP